MAAPFPGSLFYDLYGAPTGLGVPPAADFPYTPSSAIPDAASALQEPAAPSFVSPDLVSPGMPGLRERLAAGLAALPGYQARPYESGGSRFGRGLIAGLGQGFSRGVQTDVAAKTAAAEKANAVNRAAADRTNALLADKYKAELANYYKQQADATGKFTVTQKMSEETGLPVGARVDPVTLAERKLAREQFNASQARDAETKRNHMAVESRLSSRGPGSIGGAFGQPGVDDVANQIADAIVAGKQPPDMKGLYRYGGPVRAALAERGYDMTKANADWQSVQRWVSTANGSQQVRMRQAANTAYESLDVVDELSARLSQQIPRGRVKVLNRAALVAAQNGAFGPEAQSTATQLGAQITDITSELGNVYMGGNSPTDHALKLAQQNLSADWSEKQLRDATQLARTNLRIRLNSMNTITPTTPTLPGRDVPAGPETRPSLIGTVGKGAKAAASAGGNLWQKYRK